MEDSTEKANPGTTSILFPETLDGGPARDEHGRPIEDDPNDPGHVPEVKAPAAPPKAEAPKKETAPPQKGPEQSPTPEMTEYLKDLGVKVKTNIFGKEGEVTVEELVRQHQKFQAGDELLRTAKEVKTKLDEERAAIQRERLEWEQTKGTFASGGENYDEYGDGKNDLAREVNTLREQLQSMAPLVGRMRYQSDVDVIDLKMKQMGNDDFKEYIPKIESYILSQPEDQQQQYHTMMFYENFYLSAKLAEKENQLLSKTAAPPDQRAAPNVPNIEGGAAPASVPADDTSISNRKMYDKAKTSGNLHDWGDYLDKLNTFQ